MNRKAPTRTNSVQHPRIAFCQDSLEVAGSENHVIRLLEGLPNFGYQVALIVNSLSGSLLKKLRKLEIEIVEIPISPTIGGRLSYILKTARFLHNNQFDIAQVYNDIMVFYVGLAAKIAGTSQIIFALRNTRFIHYSFIKYTVIGWACRYLVNGIIVNSKAAAQLMVQKYHIPLERIWVVYNGAPILPDFQRDNSARMRDYLGIPISRKTVGILARHTPVKRIDILIKAAVLLHDLPIQFMIIGDGPERSHLEAMIMTAKQSDRFIFAGYQEDPLPWLAALDIGVLCSESEGFPQAVLEYMATGLPVVATAVGGIPELVVEGETGYLVPPDDPLALALAIRRLIENQELCVQLGSAGQKRARQLFSLQQETQSHATIYNTLLAVCRRT